MKKTLLTILLIIFLAIAGGIFYRTKITGNNKVEIKQTEVTANVQSANEAPVVIEKAPVQTNLSSLTNSALLEVPFTSQAPFAKWDALHEDACEEASLIMVKYFLDGAKTISKSMADTEIKNMIGYENKNKYGISITLEQLNAIAKNYYHLPTGRVGNGITVDDIKKELSDGKPVIVGAAGKILPNPNFKNGGPNYHMLVVVGYDDKGFITNDPGTRLGEGFRYTFDGLFNAIHDWDPKNILNGGKNYLVFD